MPSKKAILISGLLAIGALTLVAANTPMIGMVSSGAGQAGVVVDGARVSSNATLLDGSDVSANGFSRLQLTTGTRVDLSSGSRVRVYANHALLEQGGSEVQSTSGYSIDARTLRIQPAEAASVARVRLDGDDKVSVTALGAAVNVWSREGILVARVMPAMPMAFLPQAGASNSFSNTGCVVNKSGAALLVDTTGNQVFELRSGKSVDLRKFVGKRAKVAGTIDSAAKAATGASQVVNVSAATVAEGASCSDVAARLGATTTAAGLAAGGAAAAVAGGAAAAAGGAVAAGAGVSAAVIGGVAAASAVAIGTAVAVTQSNSSP